MEAIVRLSQLADDFVNSSNLTMFNVQAPHTLCICHAFCVTAKTEIYVRLPTHWFPCHWRVGLLLSLTPLYPTHWVFYMGIANGLKMHNAFGLYVRTWQWPMSYWTYSRKHNLASQLISFVNNDIPQVPNIQESRGRNLLIRHWQCPSCW